MDDSSRRLQSLYDKLRNQSLSKPGKLKTKASQIDIKWTILHLFETRWTLFADNAVNINYVSVTDGLFQIATSLDGHDYQQGLGLVQWIVQKANFSEVSSFLPGIKNLTQIAAQLQV